MPIFREHFGFLIMVKVVLLKKVFLLEEAKNACFNNRDCHHVQAGKEASLSKLE